MWGLRLGELKEGDSFHPSIHAAADKVARARAWRSATMRKRDLEAEVHRFMDVYNEAWGRQLGLRPDHRRRGRVPGQEPEAGPRRALGLDRRARRRGGRRRADAARHQPGAGADERDGCCPSAGAYFLRRRRKIDRLRVFALGVKPEYQHLGVAAALYERHLESAADPTGRPGATWAGSWRPTSR